MNKDTSQFVPILPLEAYTSEEWFEKEQTEIFGKCWQFAGMIWDLPEVGDRLNVNSGKYNILILRNEDGILNAFHSNCRHRGMLLDKNSAPTPQRIVCPYHKWTYNLDGELTGVPGEDQFEQVDKKCNCLKKASIAVWKEMIFVHPDENAEEFSKWIAPLKDKMGPHNTEKYVEYGEGYFSYEVKANWKIFVENFIDGHHLQFLHSKTLNMYDHDRQLASFEGSHWTFFEPLTEEYRDWALSNQDQVLPELIPHHLGAYVHMVFPNLGISETESWWSLVLITPVSPSKTMVYVRTRSLPESVLSSVTRYFSDRSSVPVPGTVIRLEDVDAPLESGDFMIEDIYICEQIQKSMESPEFRTGPLASEREDSIIKFQSAVLDHIND